jgi:hypothetical protein
MYEIVSTSRHVLHWRSERTKYRVTVKHLIEEISYLLHVAHEHGTQGFPRARGPMGFAKIPYLVERGLMRPMIRSIGDEDDDLETFEITSVPDVEQALQELKDMLAQNPLNQTKDTRPL